MICEKINFLKNVMLKFHEVHVFVLNFDSQHIVSRFGAFNFFNGFFGVKSQVLRDLSKDTVVILDGLNYIKGYRYELYCASKSVKTTQVTVHCDISPPTAWLWNESRLEEKNRFISSVFRGFSFRQLKIHQNLSLLLMNNM